MAQIFPPYAYATSGFDQDEKIQQSAKIIWIILQSSKIKEKANKEKTNK